MNPGSVLHSSAADSARLVCAVNKIVPSGTTRMAGTKNIIGLGIDPPIAVPLPA